MRAYVRLALPDGSAVDLCPGDLIGRLWSAALRVDNARVSEAHALVSLRGQHLKMLALRGVIAVDKKRVSEVQLVPGVRIQLARGYELEVLDVAVPTEVYGLQLPGLPVQELSAPVYGIVGDPQPGLLAGHVRDALATVWSTGEGWRLQTGSEPSVSLEAGQVLAVGAMNVEVVMLPISAAALSDTRLAGRLHKPLRIVAQYDTVHLHREGEPTLSLGGLSARILSELVAFDGPVSWDVVAEQIWRDEPDRYALRHKWDVSVSRLRGKLRSAGLRPDLVRADGSGTFELLTLPGDTVEDRT